MVKRFVSGNTRPGTCARGSVLFLFHSGDLMNSNGETSAQTSNLAAWGRRKTGSSTVSDKGNGRKP